MSDLLKINRNGQILDVALDRPEANTIDATQFESRAGGQDDGARGLQPGRTAPRGGTVSHTPPYSIEGMYFYTINQIESTDK